MTLCKQINSCICCGSNRMVANPVLWKSLIDEWRISNYEVEYINRQQGLQCLDCHSNLRSMALALAIMRCFTYRGIFQDFIKTRIARKLKILEINTAGSLTQFLSQLPGHYLGNYPEVNMMSLKFADESFDMVVHSDTLEHIPHPITGLSECYRVLKLEGLCIFTVPMIVNRLTNNREGLAPSYHGTPEVQQSDLLVYTEYGCDAWKHTIQAGFQECRIISAEYPAAQAIVAVK
ncbi:MAG: class I SAM-dependent methyltransferase [Calothrix sp. MO_192.B10]|nr:class I SAM-dependent methyltransferase [Calothrix sp. MO_192.B10]